MSRSGPLISVIIPAFDCEAFLAEAVESVRAQSHQPVEIIIVDDGSTDATPAVIQSLGTDIRSARQPNLGPAAARNLGLEIARGEFIAFLDADDLWTDGKLRSQLDRLIEDPEMQVLVGATQRVRAAPDGTAVTAGRRLEAVGPVWMLFHLGAGLFRREVFATVGTFDVSLRQGEDVDWFMRAREAHVQIGISNDLAQLYRIHQNNMTREIRDKDRCFLAAVKKSLDRRRAERETAPDLPPVPGLADFNAERGVKDS